MSPDEQLLAEWQRYRHRDGRFYLGHARLQLARYHHRRLPQPSLWFREIYVPPRFRGHGDAAAAVRELLRAADRWRVAIVLNVHSFGTRVARRVLVAWYQRLGFVPINLGYVDDFVYRPRVVE